MATTLEVTLETRREGSAAIDGDEDIVAVLIAAMAVREMDPEADRHELTSLQMDTVRELVARTFEPAAPTPRLLSGQTAPIRVRTFRNFCLGRRKGR